MIASNAVCSGGNVRSLLVCAALLAPLLTHAGQDRLDTPAFTARKAASTMMLDVLAAGSRLVAVGEYGVVLYSDSAGKSWQQAEVPVSVTLTAAHFPTTQTGWAVGHDGVILRSDDGGKRWVKQFDGNRANALMLAAAKLRVEEARAAGPTNKSADMSKAAEAALDDAQASAKFGPSRPLFGVWFKDASEGLVVGAFGQLFHTADGGRTWVSWAARVPNPDGLHFNAISASSTGALLVAAEAGKVFRSQDSGKSWVALDTGYKGQLYGALGIAGGADQETLLAFGFGGRIFRSMDRGAHWQESILPETKPVVSGKVLADGSVLLLNYDGGLYRSGDMGRSFTKDGAHAGMTAAAMTLVAGDTLVVAGAGGTRVVTLPSPAKSKP